MHSSLILVQDTKKPNQDPFPVSAKGLQKLQQKHGKRFVSLEKVIIKPDSVTLPPVKKIEQKPVVEQAVKGKAKSRKRS